MKTALTALSVLLTSLLMAYCLVKWIDNSFIENYAIGHNIEPSRITLTEERDCNGSFDDKYGICID